MSEIYIVEKELSYVIMKSAFEVHNALGPGFPEAIYEEAMNRELARNGVSLERQKRIKVLYKDEPIGEFILDNIADGRVILEYKAVSEIAKIHEQQALSYLKATGLELAIVINFGAERVQSSRVVYNKDKKARLSPRALLPRKPSK
ncbi:MAG: GxxExxY protein [Anaerolineales bacterium]|nr:MAG: GxxExxY protein [Anaerolineales bacterium]